MENESKWISEDELKNLKDKYKVGSRVMAVNVQHIKSGEVGVVGEVKDNGNILIFWLNGIVSDVQYQVEEIHAIREKGCILGRKTSFMNGKCEGSIYCDVCGWNYEVAERRKMMIRNGLMEKDKRGITKLVVSKY